jgi:hypothetical protein
MRRTITFLGAVLMLAGATATAQDKMKESAKPSHEGMA